MPPPPWHIEITAPVRVPPSATERGWRPWEDTFAAVVTTVFVALAGPVAGLVWAALGPQLSIPRVVAGSEAAFRTQLGADVSFLAVGVVAGIVCTAVAMAGFRGRGPGVLVGLAVGGLAAAFIADRVGYLVHHESTVTALRAVGATPSGSLVSLLDFRVRALGVVTAWPLTSVIVHAFSTLIAAQRRSLP